MGQLGDDAGEPLILGGGIEEQSTQDDLAAGIEATAFGGDPGVERIEASLGLGKTLFRQFDRFGSGGQPYLLRVKARSRTEHSVTQRTKPPETTVGDKGAL